MKRSSLLVVFLGIIGFPFIFLGVVVAFIVNLFSTGFKVCEWYLHEICDWWIKE